MNDKYIAINCEFLDRLEDWCIKKTKCKIVYRQGNFPRNLEIEAQICVIISKDKAEFLVLDNADEIRLDRIISVNDYELIKNSCRIG
jgi:transcriptional antiterminator Rof (Rho-off)